MATRKKRAAKARKPRRRNTSVVVVGKRRRRSVGAIGSTHRPRRRRKSHGLLGSTGGGLKQIVITAAGMAGGALLTHMALRPLEHHVTGKFPMAGKLMGAAEILIGGLIAWKGKSAIVKGVGMGVMGGGVHTLMHQFDMGKHNPAISGPDDYSTVRVPISGAYTEMIAGVIRDNPGVTHSSMVAGGNKADLYRSYLLAGSDNEDGYGDYLPAKGYNF